MNLVEHTQEVPRSRPRIEVLFEFTMTKPRPSIYRAVRATDGSFRMERRGQDARKFLAIMCCGSEESLFKFKEAIEIYHGK